MINDLLEWSRALSGWSSVNTLDLDQNQPLKINHCKKKSLSAATTEHNKGREDNDYAFQSFRSRVRRRSSIEREG